MADFFDALESKHMDFIKKQNMFFVATAPKDGRINLSPKGLDSFRILSPTKVAYLDHFGSGNETAAHLLDDGRITIMFNSFSRNALIMRLYGTGISHGQGTDEFNKLMGEFPETVGVRQIFVITINSIQTSCGWGVPVMEAAQERETLIKSIKNKGEQGMKDYGLKKNLVSIDGLETGLVLDGSKVSR